MKTETPPMAGFWYNPDMELVNNILNSVIPTFGVVMVGWFCRYIKIWDKKAVGVLNAYAYYIALPALIFQSLVTSDLGAHLSLDDLKLVGGILAAHIIVFLVVAAVVRNRRVDPETRAVAPMLFTMGSTAYLGIPYVTNTFGPAATSYAALISVALTSMLFFSIMNMERQIDRVRFNKIIVKLLELPFLYAVILGLIVGFLGWQMPHYLEKTIDVFAASASSTALLALGAFDFDFNLKNIPYFKAVVFGLGKVFVTGAVTYLILRFLGIQGQLLAIGTAMGAVSIAVSAFVISEEHKTGRLLTDAAITVSSICAFVALTAISWLWFSSRLFG
jgi:hypothetical protein